MRAIGETFDGEKTLPYLFDTIVHLYRDDKGRFLGRCAKDRSNKLPRGEFEVSYALFENLFGNEALAREARPAARATEEQRARIEDLVVQVGMTPEQMRLRLAAYGAESLNDLSEENARLIIGKCEATLANRSQPTNPGTED